MVLGQDGAGGGSRRHEHLVAHAAEARRGRRHDRRPGHGPQRPDFRPCLAADHPLRGFRLQLEGFVAPRREIVKIAAQH